MAEYHYSAMARDGSMVQGREEADSREVLAERLKSRRLLLVKARASKVRTIAPRITMALISDLASLLGSGVALERSLVILSENAGENQVAAIAASLREAIKSGRHFSQALAAAGHFDPFLIASVRAGEASGQLPAILADLERYYEDRHQRGQAMSTAMIYPLILVLVSLGSIVGLGVYAVPVFREMFEGSMASLPASTRFIFHASDFLVQHGLHLLAGSALMGGGLVATWQLSESFRLALDRLLLTLPWFGGIVGRIEAERLTNLLHIQLKSGISLIKALELTREAAGNSAVRGGLDRAIAIVRHGRGLPTALEQVPGLPILALRLVRVGDETGQLAELCGKGARLLQRELQQRLTMTAKMVEHGAILVMGALVAFVVTSMLMAVFSTSDIVFKSTPGAAVGEGRR